ncbi:CbtA family protein [Methylopila sp. 73B]|uniref:CbtA family protein n=1 Tax=Methylopila sp. 73B TaxID=1120792 RepID=UPI000374A03D|nr:CbtA family protein [Methylopila sp. 73B]
MMGNLLLRGMMVGVLAGLLAFAFAKTFGEPLVDRAIAFEEQMSAAAAHGHAQPHEPGEAVVSRSVQAGVGLFTGLVVYSAAFGGLFTLVYAFAYGRLGDVGPRGTAALVALACFVALIAIPALKYPANPPAVGEAETIGFRTVCFFTLICVSVAATAAAVVLTRILAPKLGVWSATLAGGAALAVAIGTAFLVLPTINEVPENFPATLLWQFRVSSLAMQAVFWATLGLAFGALTERSLRRRLRPAAFTPAA